MYRYVEFLVKTLSDRGPYHKETRLDQCKSTDLFLYHRVIRHERVNTILGDGNVRININTRKKMIFIWIWFHGIIEEPSEKILGYFFNSD